MNNSEQETQEKHEYHDDSWHCCGPKQWKKCCPDIGRSGPGCFSGAGMPNAMTRCFSRCWYFFLFPVVLGTIFLLLGYFLGPEVTRALWMIGAGLIVVMGLFGLLAMRRIAARIGSSGCC